MKAILSILFLVSVHLCSGQAFYPQELNVDLLGEFGVSEFEGGGGISFVDFNLDGLDDLTFGTENDQEIVFYENKGDHFELVNPPFVSVVNESKQLVWVDYDNDDDKDFFVSTYKGEFYLFENDGNMNFTDVTDSKGLSNSQADTYSANFADIDQDGWLDLYIGRYGEDIAGDTNSMFRYNSTLNKYVNVTNLSATSNGFRQTLATAFFDFDLDGDLDLYVSNDRLSNANSLYMNLGNFTFVDISVPSQTDASIFAMNAAVSDFDDDGLFDVFITNIGDAIMYKNNGNNTFTNVANTSGCQVGVYAWTGNFLDYDHDQDEDIYVCTNNNGVENMFFVNENDGTFSQPLLYSGGLAGVDTLASFTNAIGDFNNDGRQDIAVSRGLNEHFSLFSNNEETSNNYIKLKLEGTDSSKDAYGALIEVWIDGVSKIYQTHSTIGYQSQNSDEIILGIGSNQTIDSLVIKWPFLNSVDTYLGTSLLTNGTNLIYESNPNVTSYFSPLCLTNHSVNVNPIPSQEYGASQFLDSSSIILNGSDVLFQSEQEITLDIDFQVELGAEFLAEINNCDN